MSKSSFWFGGSSAGAWPPPNREPLPSWPVATGVQPPPPVGLCWSENGDYLRPLSSPFPKVKDRRIVRGNFCGVRVPGYTGGDGPDPGLLMTWQLTGSPDDQMRLAVDYYVDVCGYLDIVLSRPQTLNQGRALDDLIRVALYCQTKGLNVHLVAVSDGDPFSAAIPWLDAMISAGALVPGKDTICACWQIDRYYDPMGICTVLNDGSRYANNHDFMFGPHWGGGYPGWAENCAAWDGDTATTFGINDRWSFQRWFSGICALPIHYGQCNDAASVDAVQSWIYKIIIAFLPSMVFIAAEMAAQPQYDHPNVNPEVYGDQKTRIAMAALNPIDIRLAYLGGGREVDGSIL